MYRFGTADGARPVLHRLVWTALYGLVGIASGLVSVTAVLLGSGVFGW
jgi:hypothetical protein